ncbi:hypothetical protein SAMD00023353_3700600 [Rosellinia necatrix]|uniref:DUF5672 domain-containing protein n=1 Tax=Rosellinia necatrix TaxID=77044 RepID=A0A1W2TLZ2_ROSNE|nr:hypothetical protein SAMD00023353_3700600 [Rosellinia necatrix]
MPFAITQTRVLAVLALIITWWVASLLPHYTPTVKEHVRTRLGEARQRIPKVRIDWRPLWHHEEDQRGDRFNRSKVALLIEPRPLPHLVPQILHMMAVVPADWRFVFVGTGASARAVGRSRVMRRRRRAGKLDLLVLPAPWEIDGREKVHRLLTDARFYDEFLPGVEWLLRYEHDSILCANSAVGLDEWLDWDWAGAPRTVNDRFSGNGGLSIRRVSTIKRVLGFQARHNDTAPEDEWFGTRLWVLPGARVAAGQRGQLAVEDQYVPDAMGFHVRDGGRRDGDGAVMADAVWKDPARRRAILDYCPELGLVMDMKLERERCPGDNLDGTIQEEEEEEKGHE